MAISDAIVQALVDALENGHLPNDITNEADFERRFVEPTVTRIVDEYAPDLHIAVHPWGDKAKGLIWKASKSWAAIEAWGMKHTLDLAILDSASSSSIAVEVAYYRTRNGRLPSSEFRRTMGQALLGRARHQDIIVVLGLEGPVKDFDDNGVATFLRERRIWLVFRHVPEGLRQA